MIRTVYSTARKTSRLNNWKPIQVATIKYFHLTNEKNRILEKSGKYENDLEKDDIVQPAVIEANSAYKRDRGIHICFIPPY